MERREEKKVGEKQKREEGKAQRFGRKVSEKKASL